MRNHKTFKILTLLIILTMSFGQIVNASAATKKILYAKSITVEKSKITLTVGKTAQIKATIKPGNVTTKGILYSSSNNNIAKVGRDGKITAIAAGNATITLQSKDNKAKASIKVTVNQVSNITRAKAVINSLASGNPTAIQKYVSKTGYIQHNLAFADGRQTMLDALPALKNAGTTVKIVRSFEDDDYVVLQSIYNLFGAGEQVGFDVFRFEKGIIVEHWDNLIDLRKANPSGHTQTDGTTKIIDKEMTEENKKLVANFVKDVLVGEKPDNITNYIEGDNYIQHNPDIADGLSGLNTALTELGKAGIAMVYNQTHMILGQGNFVLAVSEGTFGGQATSYYDLFRVENGKIVEHWDAMETIAPISKWKNSNGKF